MKLIKKISKLIKLNIQFIKNEINERQINTQKKYNYAELYNIVHQESRPCFVLSTGRCGTALLTKIFKQDIDTDVHHTPIPELVYYSKFAYENYASFSSEIKYIVDAARYEHIRNSFLLNNTFIETNNRITFFAFQLKELYPKAKFIHIIRNPINFIKSGMARNWYTGKNPHDEGHLIMNNNIDLWNHYSQTEKIAWSWNETNQFIEEFKQQIEPERILTLFAEDLFKIPVTTINVLNFLNLSFISNSKIVSLINNPVNKGNEKKIKSIKIILNNNLQKILALGKKYNYF